MSLRYFVVYHGPREVIDGVPAARREVRLAVHEVSYLLQCQRHGIDRFLVPGQGLLVEIQRIEEGILLSAVDF